ncbi:MAG TPA: hypothetical protein VF712_01280 [Thermoleophilaceae bacterium]|jgi:hypothetical protein
MERSAAPNQGVLLGSAGILLATAVLMVEVRFAEAWSNGVHLAIVAAACAALFFLGARERFSDGPRPHQSALLVSSLALSTVAIGRLGDVLADDPFEHSLTIAWMAGLFAAVAAVAAFYYGSAVCTLFAAAGAATAVIALLDKATAEGVQTDNFRFYLTALAVAFGAGSVWLRRLGRERHSVQLVNAAALTLMAVAISFVIESFAASFDGGSDDDGPGFPTDSGWELVLMIGSFWILAYAALRREAGPAWLGAVLLNVSALVAAADDPDDATIVGWPLAMLLLGLAALGLALRPPPRTPPPPPPPPPA